MASGATQAKTLNPQALKRLHLATLITKTGLTSVTNTTIGNWIAAGCPTNADGTLSMIYVLAWLAAERRKKPEKPAASAIEGLRKAQAARAEFELQRRRGDYVLKSDVIEQNRQVGRRIRRRMEMIEKRHGRQVGNDLRAMVDDLCRELKLGKSDE